MVFVVNLGLDLVSPLGFRPQSFQSLLDVLVARLDKLVAFDVVDRALLPSTIFPLYFDLANAASVVFWKVTTAIPFG